MLSFFKSVVGKRADVLKNYSAFNATICGNNEIYNDHIRSTITMGVCLHEAGHILMARISDLSVNKIFLPSFDSYFSESAESAGVGVDSNIETINKSKNLVYFFLGGLFGEIMPYDDQYLRLAEADIHIMSRGIVGDLYNIIKYAENNSEFTNTVYRIISAINKSDKGINRKIMFQELEPYSLPGFREFRIRQSEHKDISYKLWNKWKESRYSSIHLESDRGL